MYASSEVRWFHRGALPPFVLHWFEAVAGAHDWEERTDDYVRTAADDLGVKLREGKVEAKRRTAWLGVEDFAPEAAGRIERWHKWSLRLDDEPPVLSADWIAVRKRRLNVPLVVEGAEVRPVASAEGAAQVCNLEISALGLEGAAWWSVCFEAWGDDEAALPETLRRAAAWALGQGDPPALPVEQAMGYPEWLQSAASVSA